MKIKTITPIGPEFTGDIEVENTHSYQLENGCVSHNTVSQLVNSASGIHARHSKYYIRTIRSDNKDPLCKMMKEMGFPWEPEVNKPEHTTVFSFPMASPKDAIMREDVSATKHLELWLFYKKHWAEHTVSITVSVKEDEWFKVAAFVFEHFNDISGISFLPYSDHVYKQAPYQECTEEEYNALLAKMPKNIDWSLLSNYETSDTTVSTRELACTAGSCEI